MLDLRSPTKADYRRHPHHLRFASQPDDQRPPPVPAQASKPASSSAHSSPMLGGASSSSSSSAARLAEHFQARSFSLSTPSPSGRPPASFQPRVLDDVFGSGGGNGVDAARVDHPGCVPSGSDLATPTAGHLGQRSPSWLSGATAHEQSFPLSSSSAYLPAPAGRSSNLPLFSPFDPFAATSSLSATTTAAKSPGLSTDGMPPPPTPSTAYIESLTRAHRGSFLRSLSSTSSSSSFSASGPYSADDDDDGRLGFSGRPAHELISPSGESLADVTDFYFSSDAGGARDDDDEEMMTESDTTECVDARSSQLLSPTRSDRSTYAEQLREYTLSVRPLSLPRALVSCG